MNEMAEAQNQSLGQVPISRSPLLSCSGFGEESNLVGFWPHRINDLEMRKGDSCQGEGEVWQRCGSILVLEEMGQGKDVDGEGGERLL